MKYGPKAGYVWPAVELDPPHDGDTISLDVDLGTPGRNKDLGFHLYTDPHGHLHLHRNFRVLGENAAELNTPAGQTARQFVAGLLPPGTKVTIHTQPNPDDKFGDRYDAKVTLPDGRDLATVEIAAGMAAPWDGRGPRPVPG